MINNCSFTSYNTAHMQTNNARCFTLSLSAGPYKISYWLSLLSSDLSVSHQDVASKHLWGENACVCLFYAHLLHHQMDYNSLKLTLVIMWLQCCHCCLMYISQPQNGDVCISILHPPVDDPQSGELPSERWNPTQNVRCDGVKTHNCTQMLLLLNFVH